MDRRKKAPMTDPAARMRTWAPREAASPTKPPRRTGSFPHEVRRAASQAPSAPTTVAAGAKGTRDRGPRDRSAGPRAGENSNCESWVREKVLFLMHPERWMGAHGDPRLEEVTAWGDLPRLGGDGHHRDPDGLSQYPREKRTSGPRIATVPGFPPRTPKAVPKSVLVRVMDYHETQEVLQTEWTRGQMTTKTEERSMTAVTFRTGRE